VFSDAALVEMAAYLPQNEYEMRKISGVGDLKWQKYGADFLREIKNYCERNNLESRIDLKSPKQVRKTRTKRDADGNDTFSITLDMFRSGMALEEIAEARGMAKGTIEMHLVKFIQSGEISLEDLVLERKIEPIRNAILRLNAGFAVAPVKEFLGENYSYAEIRAVMATM
ncbi:MAG TPA: helix-turn-helix domain-containing protein, partial [Pyrinomonadaceae bacterium]